MAQEKSLALALRSLGNTGPKGFEGLIRLLLEAWTSQKFVLARSGSQHGHDTADFARVGNVMLAECKNYEQKTRLDARGLGGQFLEAATSFTTLDLWVLVASKEVSSQETDLLTQGGDDYGVEILILDDREHSLGGVEVFCAAHPQITISFLTEYGNDVNREEVSSAIEKIRQDPEFQTTQERLARILSGLDLGFDDARRRCHEWFKRAVETQAQSRAVFNQDAAVLDDSRGLPLPREGIFAQLDEWWSSRVVERLVLSLLGEEGSGKTWAVFQWLANLCQDDDAPLIIPIAAGNITPETGHIQDVVVRALSERCKRPVEFVERRLARWLSDPVIARRILLVLDGLNERPGNQWASLLSTAVEAEWQDRLGVIITSWKGYWDRALSLSVGHLVHAVETAGYTDDELKQVLSSRGLGIGDISHEVLPLLRKPRYCDLARRMLPKLGESGDFTVERILYEDYKDRHGRKLTTPLDHHAFCEILCELAKQYREGHAALASHEIRKVVPPIEEAFVYVIEGGLFEDTGNRSQPFKVEHRWLVLGLGMLLAENVRTIGTATLEPYLDAIDQWLDPHPEMAIKTEICGAAVYVSLKGNYPSLARRALLIRWIGANNPEADVEGKLVAYVPEFFPDLIAVVDEFWKANVDNRSGQERIAWAFQHNLHRIAAKEEFVAATTRWMSLVNRRGNSFDRKREDKDGSELARQISERAGAELVPGQTVQYASYAFEVVDDDGLLRLARFALYLLSGTDCYRFAHAFIQWALSRKIMGRAHEYDEVAWVLRLSKQRLWPVLESALQQLADSPDLVQRQAAHCLLGCLGEKDAKQLRDQKLSNVYPPHEIILRHQLDPCTSPFSWSRDDCTRCMDREDTPSRKFVWDISRHAPDPTLEATSKAIKRIEEYVCSLDFRQWRSTFNSNEGDIDIDNAEGALARYVPESLAALLRKAIRSIGDRNEEGKRQLLICLADAVQIIRAEEQQAIEQVLAQYRKAMVQPDGGDKEHSKSRESLAEELGTLTQVMHKSPDAAVDYLLHRPANSLDLLRLREWIRPLSPEKIRELLGLIEAQQVDKKISRVLWILAHNSPALKPRYEKRLMQLLECENKLVRLLALQLVSSCQNQACLEHIVLTKGTFQYIKSSWEAQWGASILMHHGKSLSIAELASRMPLDYVSDAVEVRGMKEDEVKECAALVHQLWQELSQPRPGDDMELPALIAEEEEQHGAVVTWLRQQSTDRTIRFLSATKSWGGGRTDSSASELRQLFSSEDDEAFADRERRFWETVEELRAKGDYAWWISSFNPRTLSEIAKVCPAIVERWVAGALDGTLHGEILLVRCGGFYQSLCVALASSAPEQGFALWEQIRNRLLSIRFTDPLTGADWISALPFSVERSPEAESARQTILDECFSDMSLLELAGAALGHGQGDWLISQAQQLVRSDSLADRAKGIALCCLADSDDATLAKVILDADITGSWVLDILPNLRAYHDRNKWAQRWYRKFLEADSQAESWCAFRLFLKCVDRRWRYWVRDIEKGAVSRNPVAEWRIRLRRTMYDNIRQAIEKSEKNLKRVYLSIKFEQGQLIPFS